MEKIKKQLQIILYVWVWLLSFSAADAAEAITDEYWITTADRGKIEQRYRNLGIYEVAKKTVSRKKNSTEIILTVCGIRNGWKRKTGNGPWYFF